MIATRTPALRLYVDRSRPEYWVVLDRDGRFWLVPPGDDGWMNRTPIEPDDDTTLEPVPGHYLDLLGLPD